MRTSSESPIGTRQMSGDQDVGDQWAAGLVAEIEALVENPHRHALAHEADELAIELRELHYGSGRRPTHRALFRIKGDAVEVLTIRHAAQRDVTAADLGL
jgi:plasmid stabilization system protein ParE